MTYTLGGEGHGVQGQICDSLRPQLAMNRFLPLWPHRFPHFGYIHLGGGAGGGALILDRCRAFDLFASVDAHLWLEKIWNDGELVWSPRMTRKLNAFLRAAQVIRVFSSFRRFFSSNSTCYNVILTLLTRENPRWRILWLMVFISSVGSAAAQRTSFYALEMYTHCLLSFHNCIKFMHIEHIFYKHVGQERSILQAGHLAVNKCNFTLFRREMWGRCAPFSSLVTWRSINAILIYSGGRCWAGALHSPVWPPGGE